MKEVGQVGTALAQYSRASTSGPELSTSQGKACVFIYDYDKQQEPDKYGYSSHASEDFKDLLILTSSTDSEIVSDIKPMLRMGCEKLT